jgi:bifunctional DNase/RNase
VTLMHVKALSPGHNGQLATVVLETAAGDLALGFLIPLNEANRLARVLGLTRCAGVPVYELVLGMLAQLRASLARTVLDAEADGICATLVMEHEGSALPLPSHPADAIALALRTNAPIYATRAALAHACALGTRSGCEPARSQIARWLERVRPDDFSARDDREP